MRKAFCKLHHPLHPTKAPEYGEQHGWGSCYATSAARASRDSFHWSLTFDRREGRTVHREPHVGPYLKRYRADVIGARKYAKQKRQRLLLKQDVSALPHCAANGDGDTAVVALEESLYTCTYGATPPMIALQARMPVPYQPTSALDVAQQLHFELQEIKEKVQEGASRERLVGRERDHAVASKAAASGRLERSLVRFAARLESSRSDKEACKEAAAQKASELKVSLGNAEKEVQSQRGKVHKLEARVCRVQVEAARGLEEQRCIAEAQRRHSEARWSLRLSSTWTESAALRR